MMDFMLENDGFYANNDGSSRYDIYLRPWIAYVGAMASHNSVVNGRTCHSSTVSNLMNTIYTANFFRKRF